MRYNIKINFRKAAQFVFGVFLMSVLFFSSDSLNLFEIQTAQAAIALRGTSKIGSVSNGGDITLTFDTGGGAPQTGDVVFLWGGRGNSSDATAWGPITAGYTAISTIDSTGPKFGVWYKVMGATPDAQVQGEGGGSGSHGVVYGAYVIDGATIAPTIFDQTTVSTGQLSSWVPNGPSIVTQTAGAWVIAHAANSTNDTSRGTVTNYTLFTGASVNEVDDFNSEAAFREITSPGTEDPPVWSAWSAGIGGAITIALKPNVSPALSISQPDGTGDNVAQGDSYNITYSLSDTDNVVTAAFYYDTDNVGLNGTAISGACAAAAEGTNAICSWNTAGVSAGSYYVYGITNDGVNPQVSVYSPGQITISITLPGAPGTPTFSNINDTSLRASWTAASGANSYKVERCAGSSCTDFSQIASGVTNLYYDDSLLSANTIYRYRVRATNAGGDGDYSGIGTTATLPGAPGTPTFTNVGETSLTINWTAPTGGADSYKVERCTGSTCTNFIQIASGITVLYRDESSLSANTIYRYQVRATNASGDGAYSGIGSVTTSATPVITVSTAGNQTSSMIIPSSNNYVGGAFTFSRSAGSANITQIVLTETGSVNANINLSNAKIYYETAGSCSYEGTETLFGTASSFNTSAKATIIGTMPVGTSQVCAYVVLDVGSGASDSQTLEIEISNPSSEITVSDGTVAPATAVAISGTTNLLVKPTPASVSPNNGKLAGGTNVTIAGTGFLSGVTVSIGGSSATNIVVVSGTSITATTPAHSAGTVDVVVTNTNGQSGTLIGGYTYNPSPTVSVVDPVEGPIGGNTSVTIAGTGFLSGASVTFGGSSATNIVVVSGTSITATTPAHSAGTVDVVAMNSDTQSGTLVNGFSYISGPVITSVSPDNGKLAGGTNITITGGNFQNGATIIFGGVPATNIVFVSGTSITATTPAHSAGAVDVTVTNPDAQSHTLTGGYTYNPFPTISSVSPSSGSTSGTNVTIAGTGFLSGASVTFGGSSATNVVVVSGTSITATTPAHSAGTVDVVVTNTDTQSGELLNGFSYVNPPLINLTASPATISSGELSVLNWTSTDANTCTASGVWSGSKSTTGNEIVSPASTSTYTLTCDGPGGSAQSSVTVTVSAQVQQAGGGWGGVQFRFDGFAYAGGTVLIYDSGVPVARLITGDNGSFSTIFRVYDFAKHVYSIIAYDRDKQASPQKTFPSDVYSAGRASDILIAPTINLSKRTISKNGEINIYGYATPQRKVKIDIDGKIEKEVVSSETGYYSAMISAAKFLEGSHKIKARQIDDANRESDYSILKLFNISEPFVANTDLNNDNVLTISDWSIFLSSWASKEEKIRLKIDLNGDGKINVSDLSVFLNAFSKKK